MSPQPKRCQPNNLIELEIGGNRTVAEISGFSPDGTTTVCTVCRSSSGLETSTTLN